MTTHTQLRVLLWPGLCAGLVLALCVGCAHTPNHYREEGPSATAEWDSPTTTDVKTRFEPSPRRQRGWEPTTVAAESGAIVHWPLYFEDPFEDKGHGRTDATHPHNVYRLGWEDYFAILYSEARFTANWLFLPVSAVVTPPWTPMESDGVLSRQALGYDHDAARLGHAETEPAVPTDEPEEETPAAES